MKRTYPAWLESAVFYQIYPQTFFDANNDGIGDIRGITAKLPYLLSLGVNTLWLNPCFESTFHDAGYDITDFYRVAPRYGTNADLCSLFTQARKLGMRVILDLVAGHTSIEHPWFKDSCSTRPEKYADWFIWTNSAWDKGSSKWQMISGYGQRDGVYMANFFYSQPALNYGFADPDPKLPWQQSIHAPGPRAVRAELKKIMRYWLDRGASGFRVDMAGSLIKANDPVKGAKATAALWQEVRAMLDVDYPDAAMICEWFNPQVSLKNGFHCDFIPPIQWPDDTYDKFIGRCEEFSPAFFHPQGGTAPGKFMTFYNDLYTKTKNKGFISFLTGNHDNFRIGLKKSASILKSIFTFVLTMPGPPIIYYGDEIGMRYLQNLASKEGGFMRTGSRTPMQWNNGTNAGFSKAAAKKLYLPVDQSTSAPSVAAQEKSAGSLLNFVKKLVALRKNEPALQSSAGFEFLSGVRTGSPLLYVRKAKKSMLLIALNPIGTRAAADLPAIWKNKVYTCVLGEKATMSIQKNGAVLMMQPSSYAVFRVE